MVQSQVLGHSVLATEGTCLCKLTGYTDILLVHCKNIWVTSTIFWSSQLHACCVLDMLQTSRNASNLIENLSVVDMLSFLLKYDHLAESLAI